MTADEYQWYVNLVKDRYQDLNLTYEQSEKIYKFEQDKNTNSEKHFFSAWEEWDYELTTFREILNDEQLKSYETCLKDSIQRYEQHLVELDKEQTNEIAYHHELIRFYETHFLPDLFKEPLSFSWLISDMPN